MKWLLILFLLFLLFAIIFVRYRRQIQTGLYVWKMYRKMRQMSKPTDKVIEKSEPPENAQLIRCSRCGVWTPQKNALNLRSKTFYCSTNCMEQSVKA